MARQRSVFDIVGPVMIGPSSSHTAGACRLGELARSIFGATPVRVRILLHGSFASTGPGHGTDLALVAGLLGMHPDDARIPSALVLAAESGLEVEFAEDGIAELARVAAEVNRRTENIGARRLHTILERLLEDVSFDASDREDKTILIDAAYVHHRLDDIVKDEDLTRYIL